MTVISGLLKGVSFSTRHLLLSTRYYSLFLNVTTI